MKKFLQKFSVRSKLVYKQILDQQESENFSSLAFGKGLLSSTIAFIFLGALVLLPQLGFSQATVTDPALTNLNYKATKQGQLKKAAKKNFVSATASGTSNSRVANTAGAVSGSQVNSFRTGGSCFIPKDASYTAVPRNDDGSYGPIALGFNFNLYGTSYNQVWINTNGNLTFNGPLAMYNPLGFPYNVPMVAGFWADVNTEIGGQIFFKQTSSSIIVTWDAVEPYGSEGEFSNTFQIVLTDGIDPLLGNGRNVALNHQNIGWSFGAASIFEPATVGINHGNGINYVQVGLFLFDNNNYDGPGGNYDGMYHLNGLCSTFNVTNAGNIEPSSSNFPQNNTVTLNVGQSITISPRFIGPETDQTIITTVNINGMCGVTSSVSNGSVSSASITINGLICNAGTNTITISATDDGIPAKTTTETITVNVISPCNTVLSATKSDETCPGSANGSVDLNVTGGTAPFTYNWSNGATTQDLSNLAAGTYTVTVTDANNCVATTTVKVGSTPDVTAPVISAPANVNVSSDNGNCAATNVALGNAVATDNCTLANVTNNAPASFPIGSTTVTWTATDASGNTATATQLVTITDTQAPVALAQNVSVTLVNGFASVTAAQVNNGSSDACGIASLALNKTTFTCNDLGKNVVTLTVTDVNGNVSTASAFVNIMGATPSPAIVVTRSGSNQNTGAGVNTIYMGYGNQAVNLTATNTTSAATSYAWSPAIGLTNATIANPVFTPTAAGTYTFNVTATNEFGCAANASVTIEVIDARVGGTTNKVMICHGGKGNSVSASAVAAHIAHGCTIGSCGGSSARNAATVTETVTLFEAFPNPFSGKTNLEFSLNQDSKFSLEVLNLNGTLVKLISEGNANAGKLQAYEFEAGKLSEGIYLVRLVTETEVKYFKMMLKH